MKKPIDWSAFAALPASPADNFEALCRNLIRRHYGQFGILAATANQAGVEFHLNLHSPCDLGEPERWYGWQCKWFDIPKGKNLNSAQKEKIEKSLKTTQAHLPDLTDWILWTRQTLSKEDQKWFLGLEGKLHAKARLALSCSKEVEDLLSGNAAILRESYFGELVLLPTTLGAIHSTQTAKISQRWIKDAHQITDAERELRQMLGEASAWDELLEIANALTTNSAIVASKTGHLSGALLQMVSELLKFAQKSAETLNAIHRMLKGGDFAGISMRLETAEKTVPPIVSATPRKLRGAREIASLHATNIVADIRDGLECLREVVARLSERMIAVVAEAGGGKTQLSAEISAESGQRPCGVFLLGRTLCVGQSLDSLAHQITIPGRGDPLQSFEGLVAAIDAVGQRARCRLPLVIDGLNEAQDAREWKPLLAALQTTLADYPHVLLICTLRTGTRAADDDEMRWMENQQKSATERLSFVSEALPETVRVIESRGFGGDLSEAVERYFQFYKIERGDADLPWELLGHPLSLRLFCEVTNPDRVKPVGVEKLPASLAAMFEEYVKIVIQRIAELSPNTHRLYAHDIRVALAKLAEMLWKSRAREISESAFRLSIGDSVRSWNYSLVRALEEHGLILRMAGTQSGEVFVVPIYDALGGYLIGDYLVGEGRQGLQAVLASEPAISLLFGGNEKRHPLATDIFVSMISLAPKRGCPQLWKLVPEGVREYTLVRTARLEAAYLDGETVSEIAKLVSISPGPNKPDILWRLFKTRGALHHPLNIEFTDKWLRNLSVSERDLRWTEWIRRSREKQYYDTENHDMLFADVRSMEQRWMMKIENRSASDCLRAKWVMWLLTTTDREFRDVATRCLYWFGRGSPKELLEIATEALSINDPYVPERTLAAAYGVAMALHVNGKQSEFIASILPAASKAIFSAMFAENAPHATTHILLRDYARRILEISLIYHPKLFSKDEVKRLRPPYKYGGIRSWKQATKRKDEIGPFQMDFSNYTVGRLFPDRSNYDNNHSDYQIAKASLLWRVYQLGWSDEKFGQQDRLIANSQYDDWRGRKKAENRKTDRYGKKYSWIAYFEMAGFLGDTKPGGRTRDEGSFSDVDIDPSFPERASKLKLIDDDYLGEGKEPIANWIKQGEAPPMEKYLEIETLNGFQGSWVALDGFFVQQDEKRGRRIFCFIRSFLVKSADTQRLLPLLTRQSMADRWLPEVPTSYYTFAGEIPWSSTSPNNGKTEFAFKVGTKTRAVKVKKNDYYLDGKLTNVSEAQMNIFRMFGVNPKGDGQGTMSAEDMNRLKAKTRIVNDLIIKDVEEVFEAIIPVQSFSWESYHCALNDAGNPTLLSKELLCGMKLQGRPQTFDAFDANGSRAALGFSDQSDDFNNSQNFYYIRKDVLRDYLDRKKLDLVWVVWGERDFAYTEESSTAAIRDRQILDFRHYQKVIHHQGRV